MGINGHRKGNKNEREGAKAVSKWTGREFRKVPRSGGLGWKTAHTTGDITCIVEGHYCPFSFELKFYSSINLAHCILPEKKGVTLRDWWLQAQQDADSVKKVPVLMCRYNGMPRGLWLLGIPHEFYFKVKKLLPENHGFFTTKLDDYKVTFISSQDFFKTQYKEVRKAAKIYAKN